MTADPQWGMPTTNWTNKSSFADVVAAPTVDPDAAPLVQLPCINETWLPLVLGALDQLRLPYAWDDTLSDTDRNTVLMRVDLLRSMFNVVNVPCCNVQMRLTSGCELQWSVDGGVSWTTVTGWDTYLQSCVQANVPPSLTNPQGDTLAQQQCNVAGYLAAQIIQGAITTLNSSYASNASLLQAADDVGLFLAGVGFIWTAGFIDAITVLYQAYNGVTASQFGTAATDPTLKSDLTCAIFANLGTDPGITPANFTAVKNAICAISYTYPAVIAAICAYVTALGETGLAALEVGAALVDEDCSACGGPTCYEWKWYNSNSWSISYGTYGASLGYEALNCVSPTCLVTCNLLEVQANLISAVPLTEVDIRVQHSGVNSNFATLPRQIFLYHLGSLVRTLSPTNAAFTSVGWVKETFPATTVDQIIVEWVEDFSGVGALLDAFEMRWSGSNPFTPAPCTDIVF